jgi:hypothetical protein
VRALIRRRWRIPPQSRIANRKAASHISQGASRECPRSMPRCAGGARPLGVGIRCSNPELAMRGRFLQSEALLIRDRALAGQGTGNGTMHWLGRAEGRGSGWPR